MPPELPLRTDSQIRVDFSIQPPLKQAIDCLIRARLLERRAVNGLRIGLQSSLSMHADGSDALNLAQVHGGKVIDSDATEHGANALQTSTWQTVIDKIQKRFGFPLEPEFFSNMLFVAYLGHLPDKEIRNLAAGLLETYRDRAMFGLYNFFASMRFAADIDCTGVAMRSRLAMGDVDPKTKTGASILRTTTSRILKSAAVCDVPASANRSYGKDNGPLECNVFKVYLDDHEVQGKLLDRGLKQDAAVVCHGLYAVLFEVACGLRDLREQIELLEYVANSPCPRQRYEIVETIIMANIAFLRRQFSTGAWLSGTRYYTMPAALLCFMSELCASFEALFKVGDIMAMLRNALIQLRTQDQKCNALELAFRAIAAQNLGLNAEFELISLLQFQDQDGGFSQFCPLYRMPTAKQTIYFGSPIQTLSFAIRALSQCSPISITPTSTCGETSFAILAQHIADTSKSYG